MIKKEFPMTTPELQEKTLLELQEIAKELGLGIGEVKLVIDLFEGL